MVANIQNNIFWIELKKCSVRGNLLLNLIKMNLNIISRITISFSTINHRIKSYSVWAFFGHLQDCIRFWIRKRSATRTPEVMTRTPEMNSLVLIWNAQGCPKKGPISISDLNECLLWGFENSIAPIHRLTLLHFRWKYVEICFTKLWDDKK